MSPEQKDHRGSGSTKVSSHEMDFSRMDEEMVREKKRLFAPLFGEDEESGAVENVIYTKFQGYVLVKHNGTFHMTELEGDSPRLVSWEEVKNMPQLQQWCSEFFD
ncbi:MAG: hypothetical protein K9J48_03725 [Desulfohalobiaceae bacterium]|nr:hypothetical protein [Desulfohalobiaceae bacterium]